MQSGKCLGQPLIVAGKPSEASRPPEATFYNPAPGQQDKPTFGLLELYYLQTYPVASPLPGCRLSAVPLVHIGYLYNLASGLLYSLQHITDPLPVAFICRAHHQCQQVAQRVDCDMGLRTFAPLSSVIACTSPRFRCGLKGT